jgi:hypothetical protein
MRVSFVAMHAAITITVLLENVVERMHAWLRPNTTQLMTAASVMGGKHVNPIRANRGHGHRLVRQQPGCPAACPALAPCGICLGSSCCPHAAGPSHQAASSYTQVTAWMFIWIPNSTTRTNGRSLSHLELRPPWRKAIKFLVLLIQKSFRVQKSLCNPSFTKVTKVYRLEIYIGLVHFPITTQNISSSTHHIKSFDACMEQ